MLINLPKATQLGGGRVGAASQVGLTPASFILTFWLLPGFA